MGYVDTTKCNERQSLLVMSRLTQMIDYINKDPKELDSNYIRANYTHFSIDKTAKKVRRKMRVKKKAD